MAVRLPTPGGDNDVWGNILNSFLEVSHNGDGTLQTSALKAAGGVTSVNGKNPSSGAVTIGLSDLGGTAIASPSNNQVLTYNDVSGKWENQNSSGGNPAYFPANQTGMTTSVETPDSVSGTDSRTDLVLPQDQTVLAIKLAGDAYPRWLITSDSTDGIWAGDGTFDPYSGPNLYYDTTSGAFEVFGKNNVAFNINGVSIFTSGNPNGSVTALRTGDISLDTGTPAIWQATAPGNSNWVQVGGSGGSNTLIGETKDTPSRQGNTSFGDGALGITTAGDIDAGTSGYNTALGYNALNQVTSGPYNTAVGFMSLTSLTSGANNTAIGDYSNASATTSNYTVAIGRDTSATADGAVAIGTDHTGTAAASSTQDLIVIGTSSHTTNVPGALQVKNQQVATVQESVNTIGASGSSQTIPDVNSSTINYITLTGNCTLTFPAAAAGKSFMLALVQDSTGSRTVTWPGTVQWSGGTAPTLTTTANKTDLLSFVCLDGTNWLGVTAGENF